MARLRIFVSSTCYDLSVLRSELRPFIAEMGYEPVMSEYSDILYDPRTHTHDSCLKEIPACDMVVLIIGARFGGTAVPSTLGNLDVDLLRRLSAKSAILDIKEKLSVTQLEVLKAIEQSIPVYAFVVTSYIKTLEDFVKHFHRPPDQLGPDEIRAYQVYLLQDRKQGVRTVITRQRCVFSSARP